jgi:HlyD family secretion protein
MAIETRNYDEALKSLKIDRTQNGRSAPRWATVWILSGVAIVLALLAWLALHGTAQAIEVETVRASVSGSGAAPGVVLNATGYIVAHHRIEVTSKVAGKVAWIGVEKGDKVKQSQLVVKLEDQEYKAQWQQAKGNVANLEAKLREMENGSRPEEIAAAKANVAQSEADLANYRTTLERTRGLVSAGVLSAQNLDDAQARYEAQKARVDSLQKNYELVKLGPRIEQIDAVRGQLEQARGQLAYAQTLLDSTEIRAPVSGTILERAVEVGEFVTQSFVGDKGAKGYVVALADLQDLQVELDINQDDFAKLTPRQKGIVTTDAYPDRKYDGFIEEISPAADRQKATVQIKVKVQKPDEFLRPEMNARVAFVADPKTAAASASDPTVVIPSSAIRDGKVFIVQDKRVIERAIKVRSTSSHGAEISDGVLAGDEVIVTLPAGLKAGDRVRPKAKTG